MLSRNELFAPLSAYEQTDVKPSAYMINQTKTPKELQEGSLVSFLQGISQNFHRGEATSSDPKNNGSRPTSLADVESKIKQRAVAIVGGQGTSSMAMTIGQSIKNRKRKRVQRSWEEVQQIVKYQSETIPYLPSRMPTIVFLRELNSKWNKYIHSALRLNMQVDHPSAIMSRFAVLREGLEILGAHVCMRKCGQRNGSKPRYGALLGENKNTWSVATFRSQRKKIKKEMNGMNNNESTVHNIEVVLVPKLETTLTLIVPFTTEPVTYDAVANEVECDEDIIGLSQKSICIVLDPQRSNE